MQGEAPIKDYMADAPEGALEPTAVLEINAELWKTRVPNALKGIVPAYDPSSGLLYMASILSDWLMVIDPDQGHPKAGISLDAEWYHSIQTVLDSERGRLFWLDHKKCSLRAVDLKAGKLVAKFDADAEGRSRSAYPCQGLELDAETGWVWASDSGQGTVTGYDADLQVGKTLSGFRGVLKLASSPKGDAIYIMEMYSRQSSRLHRYTPSTGEQETVAEYGVGKSGMPPGRIHVDRDGLPVVIGDEVVGIDEAGKTRWRGYQPPQPPDAVASIGDTLALVMREAYKSEGRNESGVALVNAKTGKLIKLVEVRYEARFASADPKGKRFFVGNGGDGSISVIDAETGEVSSVIDAANAVEDLVVDTRTGTRYLLDRLGGSQLHAWKTDGTFSVFGSAPWPIELDIDVERRLLMAICHFDAALHIWDLDSGKERQAIPLGVPVGTGDGIGDLAYDAASGVAAVGWAETGQIVAVDVAAGKVLWEQSLQQRDAGSDSGPGKISVAIGGGTLFVGSGTKVLVANAFDLRTGSQLGEKPVPSGGARGIVRGTNMLRWDPVGERLFFRGNVLDPESLQVTGQLSGVDRIFHVDEEIILGRFEDAEKRNYLVQFDAQSLQETGRWATLSCPFVPTRLVFEPSDKQLYLLDMAQARVATYDFPISAPSLDPYQPSQRQQGRPPGALPGGRGKGAKQGGRRGGRRLPR